MNFDSNYDKVHSYDTENMKCMKELGNLSLSINKDLNNLEQRKSTLTSIIDTRSNDLSNIYQNSLNNTNTDKVLTTPTRPTLNEQIRLNNGPIITRAPHLIKTLKEFSGKIET